MKVKKKILYITLRSDFGGGPMHVNTLIEHFEQTYDIFCAAPAEIPYGEKWKSELAEGHFLELPHRTFSLKYLFRLVSFIKRNKIDIIHAHGKSAGIYSRLVKLFAHSVKLIFTFHGFHPGNYKQPVKLLYLLYERLTGRFIDYYINVSKGEQEQCLNNKVFDKSKSTVIYNAITIKKFEDVTKYRLREQLFLPGKKFITITANRFDHQKNMIATIEVARKLTEHKNIMFILLGDGEEKNMIEQVVVDDKLENVLMLGYKENVLDYLFASDVCFSTSKGEGMPYSLIESTMIGLPLIVSNVTGNNEVVIHNYNGYLFEPNDFDKAAEYILNLVNSSEIRERFSRNSIEVYYEKFRLDIMLTKVAKVYSKFLG